MKVVFFVKRIGRLARNAAQTRPVQTMRSFSWSRFPFHPVVDHRPGADSRRLSGPRLAFLLALLVNVVALGALGWGIYQRLQKRTEIDLNAVRPSPKFNATSVEIPEKQEAPALARQPEVSEPVSVEPPLAFPRSDELSFPPPLTEVPFAIEPPPLAMEPPAYDDDTVLVFSGNHAPGDSPMLRNWKVIDLAGLFAVALASAPALAQQPADNTTDVKAILKRLDAMDTSLSKAFKDFGKDITDLRKQISDLQGDQLTERVELDKLATKISKLQADLDQLKKGSTDVAKDAPPVDKAGMDEIKNRLGQIEQAVLKLQAPPNRISLSPPAGTGRLMFVNLYGEYLLFTVNGRPYRVEPNRTLPLDNQTAGTFSYEVFSPTYGMLKQTTSVLTPNETLTITAR